LMIQNNSSYERLVRVAEAESTTVYGYLNRILQENISEYGLEILSDKHVLPYFHGNRSPRADASARGMLCGCSLSQDINEVALWYGATLQAIGYGTKHIIEAMNEKGYVIDQIYLSGGHLKNTFFIKEHADITGCAVVIPEEPEAVLLGGALLGAVAAGEFADIHSGMKAMCRSGAVIRPDQTTRRFHERKFEIFKDMYDFQKRSEQKMNDLKI